MVYKNSQCKASEKEIKIEAMTPEEAVHIVCKKHGFSDLFEAKNNTNIDRLSVIIIDAINNHTESFKSALREEIEKAVAESKLQITRSDFDTGYECALSEVLETIDTITPKK